MAIYTVDFVASVTVEADDEEEALRLALDKVQDEDFDRNDLEFFDFNAWEE